MTTRERVSDNDRQEAVEQLARYLAEGRLDLKEYDTRVTQAYAATYADDFDPIFADLTPKRQANAGAGQGFFAPTAERSAANDFPFVDAVRSAPWSDAVRNVEWSRVVQGKMRGPNRPHPVLIVLGIIGGLIALGILLHLLIPLAVIGGIIWLFTRNKNSGRQNWHHSRASHPSNH